MKDRRPKSTERHLSNTDFLLNASREGRAISPKKKLAIVAATAVVSLILVVVGLASLAPKSKPQSVNELPVAYFTIDANNLTVEFNASASSDPDGSIANYSWSFGDQSRGYGTVVVHNFSDNGTYTTELTVTDDKGGKNSTKKNVSVSITIEPVASGPEAKIEIVSKVNWTVELSGLESKVREGGQIVIYTWTFGDGESATAAEVTHVYAANGTYTVTLVVTDDNGATNTTSVDITVTMPWVPPEEPPEPPENETGPPGLLHAIEIHKEKADRNGGLQNSLDHLVGNLEKWIDKHTSP
jgi:PKD repeat protein